MGAALVRAATAAGFPVTVWNRDRSKADALSGVSVADSPADAGQTAFARICNTDGETVISFTLDLTPSVISVLVTS